jgi:hypothetical protein
MGLPVSDHKSFILVSWGLGFVVLTLFYSRDPLHAAVYAGFAVVAYLAVDAVIRWRRSGGEFSE